MFGTPYMAAIYAAQAERRVADAEQHEAAMQEENPAPTAMDVLTGEVAEIERKHLRSGPPTKTPYRVAYQGRLEPFFVHELYEGEVYYAPLDYNVPTVDVTGYTESGIKLLDAAALYLATDVDMNCLPLRVIGHPYPARDKVYNRLVGFGSLSLLGKLVVSRGNPKGT